MIRCGALRSCDFKDVTADYRPNKESDSDSSALYADVGPTKHRKGPQIDVLNTRDVPSRVLGRVIR